MNIDFFRGVNSELIQQICIIKKQYSKGATVHTQGEQCTGMDIVISGSLIAYSLLQNGSESIVFDFNKNSVIGANLIFGNSNNYPMNIYCTTDSVLLHISKKDIELLLHDYNFTRNFIKNISSNSQGMNKKISIYTQKTLRDNLKDYFNSLALKQESKRVILPITKKQLADYLGVQRPSLFRELKRMKDDGIIMIENKHVTIMYKDF